MHTAGLHLMGPEINVRTVQHATGRVSVEIDSEDISVTLTVASQVGDVGVFTDPGRLADQLERAAILLRALTQPVDRGDHFIHPESTTA